MSKHFEFPICPPKRLCSRTYRDSCRGHPSIFWHPAGEWTNIIGQYFPGFKMPQGSNRAELKWYAEAYRNFLKTLSYRPEELKAMCETETETHFYAEDPDSECADADF